MKHVPILYRVPSPEFLESPSSWLSRVALSQMVTIAELAELLPLYGLGDFDFIFNNRERLRDVARSCALQKDVFALMRHMFKGASEVGEAILLLRQDGHPRYRFCPDCLRCQRTPHFPLHWRFAGYRWCTEHRQLLRDRCPNCKASVVLPLNLVRCVERGQRAQLDCCAVCGGKLTNKESAPSRFTATRQFLSPWEYWLIQNGRAILAAILQRKVILGGHVVRPLKHLRVLHRSGLLPHGVFRYEQIEQPYVHFRDPWTDRLLGRGRSVVRQAPERLTQPAGLFDG